MAKRYVTNDTPNTVYVEGRMIGPGEGREVDVPDEAPAVFEEPVADPDAALSDLLRGTVAGVTAVLPGLSGETLQRLQVLEQEAAKPRKGVLEALGDALIALADAKLQGEDLGDPVLDPVADPDAAAAGAAGTDTPPAE